MRRLLERLPEILFALSALAAAFLYGAYAYRDQLFPVPQLIAAKTRALDLVYADEILFSPSPDRPLVETVHGDRLNPGLILVMGIGGDSRNFARVIDRTGAVLHEWRPDWFEIWGDAADVPENRRPESQPGALLHGAVLLPSGDLVVNFEHLSTVRLDPCGGVVWKLDNLGHHSVHLAGDGALWVSAEIYVAEGETGHANHAAPLRSWALQKISLDGEILETIEVIDILGENDLDGLLYLSSLDNIQTRVSGDTLHLNDVETFPADLDSELFEPGDVMFSLRNINTIAVMDPETREIKFRSTGRFLRQHDPDFIAGDRISVFDNRTMEAEGAPASRILEIDARTGAVSVVPEGGMDRTFFTDIMGVHQRLANGNILITSSREGRVLEVLADGRVAWEYSNMVEEGVSGLLSMAEILPPEMDAAFFAARAAECAGATGSPTE